MVLTLRLCVVYGSQKNTATFALYSINRLVFYNRRGVFTVRYGLGPYMKQIRFVFKGLKDEGTGQGDA